MLACKDDRRTRHDSRNRLRRNDASRDAGADCRGAARVAATGLPGDHHFFITFDTREDGVEIADWLRERYPEEMTIVIQHWFEDLERHARMTGFRITLNFGNSPERLVCPLRRAAHLCRPLGRIRPALSKNDTTRSIADDEDESGRVIDAPCPSIREIGRPRCGANVLSAPT
jgi:hypothetical protein